MSKSITIIAEIGWNHCGDLELAKKMILEAKNNGANFAKFQTWSVSRLKKGSWDNDGRKEIYKKAELSKEDHVYLKDYCEEIGIKFLSSVFSIKDAELLSQIGCKTVKIPSFESRNTSLIKYCNENFENIFMSTGTSTFLEIEKSLKLIDNSNLTILHCVSSYPCLPEIANIKKMIAIKEKYPEVNVGYSDHIVGVESAKVAVCLGATTIEKHFTIDNNLPGRDNKFAILPKQLKDLRDFIDLKEKMFIDHGLDYLECESDSRKNYQGRFDG